MTALMDRLPPAQQDELRRAVLTLDEADAQLYRAELERKAAIVEHPEDERVCAARRSVLAAELDAHRATKQHHARGWS